MMRVSLFTLQLTLACLRLWPPSLPLSLVLSLSLTTLLLSTFFECPSNPDWSKGDEGPFGVWICSRFLSTEDLLACLWM